MKANLHNRGSVLMEFIIVFPIYLVLFGGVFMIGDMAVKTIRLASADRTRALDVAAAEVANDIASFGIEAITTTEHFFLKTSIGEDTVTRETIETYRYHEQSKTAEFQGPWTVAVGAKAKDVYKLAPWTRSWLAFLHWFFADAKSRLDDIGDEKTNFQVLPLLNEGGTIDMFSKEKDKPRVYNYYTYRRTRDYSDGELKRMYRAMPDSLDDAGRLVDSTAANASWKRHVEEEAFPALEAEGSGEGGNKRSAVSLNLTRREYRRYGQFETWSE